MSISKLIPQNESKANQEAALSDLSHTKEESNDVTVPTEASLAFSKLLGRANAGKKHDDERIGQLNRDASKSFQMMTSSDKTLNNIDTALLDKFIKDKLSAISLAALTQNVNLEEKSHSARHKQKMDSLSVTQEIQYPSLESILKLQLSTSQTTGIGQSSDVKNMTSTSLNSAQIAEEIKPVVHAKLSITSQDSAEINVEIRGKEIKIDIQAFSNTGRAFEPSLIKELKAMMEQKYPNYIVNIDVLKESASTNEKMATNTNGRQSDQNNQDERQDQQNQQEWQEEFIEEFSLT